MKIHTVTEIFIKILLIISKSMKICANLNYSNNIINFDVELEYNFIQLAL